MEQWEMNKKAKEGVGKKLWELYGKKETKEEPESKYKTFEEAKAAGDVPGMIERKFNAKREANKTVIALTNELYESMDIKQIMRRRKRAEKEVAEVEELREDVYERELNKVITSMAGVGGLSDEHKIAKAKEYLADNPPKSIVEIEAEYTEAKKYHTALQNCISRFAVENADVIEAERERRRREEVLASGIMEELGE